MRWLKMIWFRFHCLAL